LDVAEFFGVAGIELGNDFHIGDVRNDGSILTLRLGDRPSIGPTDYRLGLTISI
jgi:hypothetical protein